MITGVDWIWAIGAVLGGAAAAYLLLNQRIKAVEMRLKHLIKRIEQVEAEAGYEEPAINDELRRLVNEGDEIRAIKAARVAFGYSLIEAKQYVDGLKENR